MASKQLDIEKMIMQARYELALETESAKVSEMSDMERKQYLKRISDLLECVSTMLDANNTLGEEQKQMEAKLEQTEERLASALDVIEQLQSELSKTKGKNASSQRNRYGKNSEKNTRKPSVDKGRTKEEEEDDYIESEGKQQEPPEDEAIVEDSSNEKKAESRDLSNRPDHYKTMHADICVFHECDLNKLKDMGLEFIRYSRPVDQYDRISKIRQDRYQYAWVRDKNGQEFHFFVPKPRNEETPTCVFKDEADYDMPHLVPHTSGTSSFLSDIAVNRFQYCISSGREMYRMAVSVR